MVSSFYYTPSMKECRIAPTRSTTEITTIANKAAII